MSEIHQNNSTILELYKLTVEMADRTSSRRAKASAFFASVNTTLVTIIGLGRQSANSVLLFVAICAAGITVSACWWVLLKNYRHLNDAKFKVINDIESEWLPIKPYSDEWEYLGHSDENLTRIQKISRASRQLGTIERVVPWIFCLIYIVILFERIL
jgi:hypothetical protein maviaA2_03527